MFKIGYLPLTKQNWTSDALERARSDARAFLASLDGVEVVGGERMLETEADALATLAEFEESRPDIVVCHFLSFALGVVPPLFGQRLGVPIVLWSIPEPSWDAGGRLERNSFCATNMNSHHLWRLKIPYYWAYGNPGEDETMRTLVRIIRTAKAIRALKRLRIGVIGGRVPGFYTSSFSELPFRRDIGPEVKYITEHEVLETARVLPPEEVEEAKKILLADADVDPADAPKEGQLEKSAALFAAVAKMKEKYVVDAFTFRCWPEVISDELYGIAACSTLGHLTAHGFTTACEGDVYGATMMRVGEILSGEKTLFCDLIKLHGDWAVAWHCGAAPCQLCREGFRPQLRCSSTVGGGHVKGVVGEFPLKPGRVTVVRLGEKRDGNGYRMFVATGEGLDTELFVRGNPLRVKFDAGCDAVRRTILEEGWEHHWTLIYGDHAEAFKDLCRNMDIELHLVD